MARKVVWRFLRFSISNEQQSLFPHLSSTTTTATAMGPAKRGALIVLEGCDRSGKTSQATKLLDRFKREGLPCKLIRFPDRTTLIGKLINDFLQQKEQLDDRAIHHLFSANRWELSNMIKTTLLEGVNVIVDRYAYSGVAFSAAKPGMKLEWCKQPDVGLPCPDLVLFLEIDPERAAERAGFGLERYECVKFQMKVYENYLLLKEKNWKSVNADRKFDDVHSELVVHIQNAINGIKTKEISGLWVRDQAS